MGSVEERLLYSGAKYEDAVENVVAIFPHLRRSYIAKVVEDTNGRVESAVEVLLANPEPTIKRDDSAEKPEGLPPAPSPSSSATASTTSQLKYEEEFLQPEEDEEESLALINKLLEQEKAAYEKAKANEEAKNEELLKQLLRVEQEQKQKELEEKTYTCLICLDEVTIADIYIMEECYHKFCKDCLGMHFASNIKDGNTRNIGCPTPTCKRTVGYNEVKHCVDKEMFAKYEEFLLMAALGDDPNCRWCPRPGCGNAMIGDPKRPMMACSSDKCKFTFCFNCKEEWHADATCEQYQKWKVENNEAESRFRKWAEANTKQCPNETCLSPIEKNGGCNHMTCSRCKYEFCWFQTV
ncbi:E3 ubiquitin-protein ligase arih2 [Balamuthia mandrillaris]